MNSADSVDCAQLYAIAKWRSLVVGVGIIFSSGLYDASNVLETSATDFMITSPFRDSFLPPPKKPNSTRGNCVTI